MSFTLKMMMSNLLGDSKSEAELPVQDKLGSTEKMMMVVKYVD